MYDHIIQCHIFASTITPNLENTRGKKKKKYRIYPHFYFFHPFLHFWHFKISAFIISFLFKIPLVNFSKIVCWQQILLAFLLRVSWFLLHSRRLFSLTVEFHVDGSLSAIENYPAASFWTPCFLIRNMMSFKLFFSCKGKLSCLSLIYRLFSLPLVRSLTMMWFGMNFFEFFLFEFTQLPESLCMYFARFGEFLATISLRTFFNSNLSSLELWWHKCQIRVHVLLYIIWLINYLICKISHM